MDSREIKAAYKTFFEQSDAGAYFIESLYKLIDSKHAAAEKNAEQSRDLTQKACGVREVINSIKIMTADTKKNRQPKGDDSES